MLHLFLLLIGLCLSTDALAVQRFHTPVDRAEWLVFSSPIQCDMVHKISDYGEGRFVFSSGGELAFQLYSLEPARHDSITSLSSVAPHWREPGIKALTELTLSKGHMPVYVGGELAYKMFYELQEGYDPTFHYKDWAGFKDDVYVTISSVNFHRKFLEFKRCISAALPYGADHVKDTIVYFQTDKDNLSFEQRKKLADIVLFAKVDKNFEIRLNGHADARGRRIYNKKLSARRIRSVEEYLLSKGVPELQISRKKAYGESRPVASNRNASGRKKNRRVEVLINPE